MKKELIKIIILKMKTLNGMIDDSRKMIPDKNLRFAIRKELLNRNKGFRGNQSIKHCKQKD